MTKKDWKKTYQSQCKYHFIHMNASMIRARTGSAQYSVSQPKMEQWSSVTFTSFYNMSNHFVRISPILQDLRNLEVV